jgi:4-hydroxy-2-oxoheptanedioate aldolase
MDIRKRDFLVAGAALGAGIAASNAIAQPRAPHPINSGKQPSTVDRNYKPRRLNKCIELWEDGQPIYYTGPGIAVGVDPYEQGKKMSKTWADAICYDMEHNPLDYTSLQAFMKGIVDGGGTASGHRFPMVFVSTPIIGLNEAYMWANSWVFSQLLDTGIMGIHLCHARDPKAVEVCASACIRFPFERAGVPKLAHEGLRGSPQGGAAAIWGLNQGAYLHKADTWPLNPHGELIFGIKIEDVHADRNVEQTMAVKGITMAEWGPGDHAYSLYGLEAFPEDGHSLGELAARPEMARARQKVVDLCKKNNLKFLNAGRAADNSVDSVIQQIKDGAMVIESDEEAAIKGREYTKRKMPV